MDAKPTDGAKREFFPQLTSVRFFAAFIVVLYHYHKELSPYLPGPIQNIVGHGYVGVSFFFLLSGFILAANYYDRLLDGRSTKKDFWWARFSRIYPVYIVSILIFMPRFLIPVASDPMPEQAAYAHAHLPEVLGTSFLGLQTFASPGSGFLNSPTWSISTEFFFYLLLPFLLPVIARIRTKGLIPAMGVLFLLAGVGPYIYHSSQIAIFYGDHGWPYPASVDNFYNQFIRANFITRLPEFLIGVLGYRLYREALSQRKDRWLLSVLFVLSLPFLWAVFLQSATDEKQILSTVLYSGQFASIPFFLLTIFALVVVDHPVARFLKSPSWILMGEASFSLYLFHIPIKNFGQLILSRVLHMPKDNVVVAIFMILVSVGVSIPIFHYFETPTRKRLMVWWKNRHPKAT